MAAPRKRVSGGDEPPRDLPLDDAEYEDASQEDTIESLRAQVSHLTRENARLEAVGDELRAQLADGPNQTQLDAAFMRGKQAGYAEAMALADKKPAEIKKAVHGDGPVTVRVVARSVFFHKSELVEPGDGSDDSRKRLHGEVVQVKSWDAVEKRKGALSVV